MKHYLDTFLLELLSPYAIAQDIRAANKEFFVSMATTDGGKDARGKSPKLHKTPTEEQTAVKSKAQLAGSIREEWLPTERDQNCHQSFKANGPIVHRIIYGLHAHYLAPRDHRLHEWRLAIVAQGFQGYLWTRSARSRTGQSNAVANSVARMSLEKSRRIE